MRKKIVFGMAIISLVAIIVLCQKAGVRLKETFRESEETNSGAVIGMKEKENEKSDKKERGEKQGEAHKKRTVVVDAGGKTGVNGKLEKELNLIIAEKVKKLLEEEGIAVIMTREEDGWLAETRIGDLKERVRIMNESKADLAVSIHQNSYHEESVFGAQVFYYTTSGEGKAAAEILQNELLEIDPENKKREKANNTYYILKKTEVPTVIVECGFLSNHKEAEKLSDEAYQGKIAEAVVKGIKSFFLK